MQFPMPEEKSLKIYSARQDMKKPNRHSAYADTSQNNMNEYKKVTVYYLSGGIFYLVV